MRCHLVEEIMISELQLPALGLQGYQWTIMAKQGDCRTPPLIATNRFWGRGNYLLVCVVDYNSLTLAQNGV